MAALQALSGVVREIAELAADFLESRLQKVFDGAIARLLQREDALNPSDDERGARLAAHVLDASRDDCVEFFIRQFLTGFYETPGTRKRLPEATPSSQFDEVEVLNGDALDLSIAISTASSRSASKHKADLERLTPAFACGGTGSHLSVRSNPLSVFRITGAFMTAIGRLQLDVSVQRLLLDEFEDRVIASLGQLYTNATEAIGLSPDSGQRNIETLDITSQVTPSAASASPSEAAAGLAELRNLLQAHSEIEGGRQEVNGGGWAAASGRRGPILTSTMLADALSHLDLGDVEAANGGLVSLRELAVGALARTGADLNDVDDTARDVLQLLSLLFEHITSDEQVSIPMASQLSRLQIPALTVALVDDTLFENPDHVVRRVINRLAAVGIGWSGDSALVRRDPLYRAIDAIVTRIVVDCHSNPRAFDIAHEDLTEACFASAKRSSSIERRLTQKEQGRARVDSARAKAQEILNGRVFGLRLPPWVGGFISDGWAQVLVFVIVRFGQDSDLWREAEALFDEFLQLAQPASTQRDIAHRNNRVPYVLERFERWFELAGLDVVQSGRHLTTLSHGFADLTRYDETWVGQGSDYMVEEFEEIEVIELVPPDFASADTLPADLEPFLAALAPGTWFEMNVGDGGQRARCKLSMIFEQTRNYLFVDHRGMRVDEIPAARVARMIRDGRMLELKDDPVVERALDEMIAELKASIERGATRR